ncbi:TPA: restriction endonuclease subunit S [Staphylococcus aureus]|nr:restriction endonuclease subunit S [Staphylococcus aureus]MBO8573252.1 restriction endonuclease subunit S [Staphylococcus aureus]MBU5049734.1 restriction endonuclease subunit S [Staphylococcus aureus]CYA35365.1 Type I restriction-modification system%2C specificity subunit S [Staphylococcus aureus]SGV13176.1 Type I restriction-modification system, specificity subunit S [Staphylococcus aureus]SGW91345.1 Type I restriction-modification system, specificity subunit S [Staphylococcus aureus]
MSNTQKKNVPELRFPGFEGEWEEKKLEGIIKVNSGKDYKHLDKGDIPVYGTGGYMTSVSEPLSEIDAVGIGRKGTINKPYLLEAPFWTVDTLFYCTPKKETDILFILSLFRKINWKVYDESTGVPSLSKQTINKINRFVPTNKEQQKIGKFFSKLDRQIELEEQKLELLQQQKKGYMQKIFSQELRFKDENGNDYPKWEEKKLGEIIILQNGFAFESSIFTKKGIPIIRITDINNSLVSAGTVYYPKNINIDDRFKIKKNDILMAMSGATAGKVGKYISDNPSLLNQRIAKFEMKYGTNSQFIFAYLNTKIFQQELTKLLVAGAQPNISSRDVEKISLTLPFHLEQQKIGALNKKMDYLIEKQQFKIKNLNLRKRWLLQKLFI